jgi:DNA modification methylase
MEIEVKLELGKWFTFEPSKEKPIYNWFYYKEAFSPEIVEFAINNEAIRDVTVLDPFCGVGTTLLTAKRYGLSSIGFDISPLAVLASKVKCENYSQEDLNEIKKFFSGLKAPSRDFSDEWQFELFPPMLAFPKRNLNYLIFLRKEIDSLSNEKIRNFFMLALLSIIPQVGIFIKDGGVLKIDKRKSAMPVKEAFTRKIKRMIRDLEAHEIVGPLPRVERADARVLPVKDETADLIVTSPPYLNNVDYTKVYGLELSLMYLDKDITKKLRNESIRSFITSNMPPPLGIPEEIGEIGYKIPVVGNYFADMEKVLHEIKRVLKSNAACYLIVSNSVIHGTEVFVDELIAAIAERLGMESEIIIGAERIADVKPRKIKIRESIVVMRK